MKDDLISKADALRLMRKHHQFDYCPNCGAEMRGEKK